MSVAGILPAPASDDEGPEIRTPEQVAVFRDPTNDGHKVRAHSGHQGPGSGIDTGQAQRPDVNLEGKALIDFGAQWFMPLSNAYWLCTVHTLPVNQPVQSATVFCLPVSCVRTRRDERQVDPNGKGPINA